MGGLRTDHIMNRRFLALASLTLFSAWPAVPTADAQVVWSRQALGQSFPCPCPGPNPACGTGYQWPNNNNWSQDRAIVCCTGEAPCTSQTYESEPSNWSTGSFPNGAGLDVLLDSGGEGGTNLDKGVGAPISLNSLTIGPAGGLNMEFGTSLAANIFEFQGSNGVDALLSIGGGGGEVFIVIPAGGVMKKTTGSGVFQLAAGLRLQAINGGTIACEAGALQLPGNQTYYAGPLQPVVTPFQFNAAAGALIDLAPASAVDSGAVRFTGFITGNNSGGVVRLRHGVITTVADTGGTSFNFAGDTFQWQGGAIQSGRDNPFVNAGTLNVTGTPRIFGDGFVNQGTIRQSASGLLMIPNGTAMANTATGVIDFRNDNGLTENPGFGAGVIRNEGMIRKSAGTGTSVIHPQVVIQNIGGAVRVDSGALALGGGLTSRFGTGDGGTFQVAPGATLRLNDGASYARYHGTYTASGGGKILLSGGTMAMDDGREGGWTFNFPAGMFEWSGGVIETPAFAPFTNAGFIELTGPVAIFGTGARNTGTMTQSGAATLNLPFGSGLTNTASGIYDIRNDSGTTRDGGGGPAPFYDNAGTFRKSAGTGTSVITSVFTNTGTVIAETGTLSFPVGEFGRSYLQTAGTTTLVGGNFSFTSPGVFTGGSLTGAGTITGSVRNEGAVIAPGTSPGKITITGDYTQTADGVLEIEIGGNTPGAGYDQLEIGGAANLGGTLNVKLINGYQPRKGDVFTIIAPASFSGAFAQINAEGFGVQANYASGAITLTVTSVPDLLLNISTRLRVGTGENALIGGFIITGSEAKSVIIRAIGPSLASQGVSGALANPTLELFDGAGEPMQFNNDWKDDQQGDIEQSTIPPGNDLESAIVRTLQPGNYTAVVRGEGDTTGIGLVEVYDLAQAANAKLANISSRGFVEAGQNVMIGGFIVGGGGGGTRVVVRAVGPSLGAAGVEGALQDPTLQLVDANGSEIRANDNWKDGQAAELEALSIQPGNDLESALIAMLNAGNYTAVVRGTNDSTGVGLVEVYSVQ